MSEQLSRDQLHEYQNYCVNFIIEHPVSLLILEMGLGKTVITLTAIKDLLYDSFAINKVLIIAPLRVARDVWPEEVSRWGHTSSLQLSTILGSPKQRMEALEREADLYVINRENIKWLVDYYERQHISWPFDMVCIDELSSFKNHQSKRWKALKKVRPKIRRIVGLTGTPASNGLMDLWAEVGLLDMGKRLGRFITGYRQKYFRPDSMNPYTGVVFHYTPLPGAEQAIYQQISDIAVSMKALDYLDMPECIFVNHYVEMTSSERKLYEKMAKDMIVEVEEEAVDAANAAVLSGKLLQMANGCIYGDTGREISIHDQKLSMLEDLIEQANGQSVLIAYWFQHDRRRIFQYLSKKGYPVRDLKSSEDLSDWNAGKIPIAVISPASAGHGLNIQAGGHILIWFSEVWSLEMVQQTNARLWRQGQKQVVTIHRILCKGTLDEDVIKAIDHKDATQERLIAAVKARLF